MRIGVDLGGTKIEGLLLGPLGEELARSRLDTPREDYQGTVRAISHIVGELEAKAGRRCPVGVATPGAISPATGRMKNANSTWLNGQRLDDDLAGALGREIRLANDANCFALSEAVDGAGRDHSVVFGVIIGTGCGGGIAMGKRVHAGGNAIAGEWGHNPLPRPDEYEQSVWPNCYCGNSGCMETWISGPGLSADHERLTGLTMTGEQIAEAAASGDRAARGSLTRLADRMARGLAVVINILDPDIIVLGGGLSHIDDLCGLIAARLPGHVFSDALTVPVVRNIHGASSGVRGAAWLWPEGA